MPSLVRVSGPVHQFLIFPGEAKPRYLGTSEETPKYEEKRFYKGVMNTLSGPERPFDETWAGSHMIVSSTLTRYDQNVFNRLSSAPFGGIPLAGLVGALAAGVVPPSGVYSGVPGTESRLSRGTLMYNKLPTLIMANSFYNTVNAFPDDLPGYLFYAVKYAGGIPSPGGTEANKIGVIFEAVNLFQATGNNKFGFETYSTTDARIQQALNFVN